MAARDPGPLAAMPRPITVPLGDLTLDQVDEVERVKTEHGAGYVTAATYVWIRAQHPGVALDDVRRLRSRDVRIMESDPDDPGPTNGP